MSIKIEAHDHMFTYIITNSENSGQPATRYISGFSGGDSLLLFATLRPMDEVETPSSVQWAKLMVDGRYWEQAENEIQMSKLKYQINDKIQIIQIHKDNTSKQALSDLIKQYSISECVVDSRITTYASILTLQEQGLNVIPSPDIFQKIREIKTKDEIVKIKKAQQIALKAFDAVRHEIKGGVTEKYIATLLEFLMKQGGAEKIAFETIVASGVNSALPHARSTDKIIEETDSIIIDFGAVYQGYCSDYTRTILMPKVSSKLRKIYQVVETAQAKALNVTKEGVRLQKVDLSARAYIETMGFGQYFTHSTGHGVGMAVHELPHVSFNSESILQKGHVITIEPGIYIPGVGGVRLEEMVII